MNRLDLIARVRSLTRDLSNAIFREIDIISYINEGIERVQQVVPELSQMTPLNSNDDVPSMLPKHYHHLLAVYSASRCFGQDERHYQASTLMNEFEIKLEKLNSDIENGSIVIVDPDTGAPIDKLNVIDHVRDVYFTNRRGSVDIDNGVEGLNG